MSRNGLLMADLEYVTPEKCGSFHHLKIDPDMFCLYGQGAKDSCKGDSGGGVFWKK